MELVPFWLKPAQLAKQPYSTINARAETIRTAPTYREPFETKHCLVPSTGWCEWQKIDASRPKPASGQAPHRCTHYCVGPPRLAL
jgi:putative SOS response-associated peptidase YedK